MRSSYCKSGWDTLDLVKIPFPERDQYGLYSQALLEKPVEGGEKLGIDFKILSDKVVDMRRSGGVLEFELRGGQNFRLEMLSWLLATFVLRSIRS